MDSTDNNKNSLSMRYTFIEADFTLDDRKVNFFNKSHEELNEDKSVINFKQIIESINELKEASGIYLQSVMESNEHLGAKIKDAEEEEI